MSRGFRFLLLLCIIYAWAGNARHLFAPFVGQGAIVIDGKVAEPVWKRSPALPLHDNGSGHERKHSMVRLLTDEHNLYVFGEFQDAGAAYKDEAAKPRDQIDWGDTVELFAGPVEGSGYFHLAMDSQGNLYDCEGQARPMDFQWNVERKTLRTPGKGWQFELRLPMKDIQVKEPLALGDALAFNICRYSKRFTPHSYAMFLTYGSFHNREALGTLHVGTMREVCRQAVEAHRKQLGNSYEALMKRANTARWMADFRKLEKELENAERWDKVKHLDQSRVWIYQVDAGKLPRMEDVPEDGKTSCLVRSEALQGEVQSLAVGIYNPLKEAVRLRCIPSSVLEVEPMVPRAFATFGKLMQVEAIPLRGGAIQRDALPVLRLEDVVTILPSRNEIVYLTMDTGKLSAGRHLFSVEFKPLGQKPQPVLLSVDLEVFGTMPKETPLPLVCDWARPHWPPATPHDMDVIFRHQREFGTNMVMSDAMGRDMGWGLMEFDGEGRLKADPSFERLQRKFRAFGPTGYYFLGFWQSSQPSQFKGGKHAAENVRRYLTALRDAAAKHGISSKHIILSLWDEPSNLKHAHAVAAAGRQIEQALPNTFETFVTLYHKSTDEMIKVMAPYVSIWCPKFELKGIHRMIRSHQRPDSRIMGYRVLSRNKGPYWDYRLCGLLAWYEGMIGMGYWNYCDAGDSEFSSVWDDFDVASPISDYSTIYEGSSGPVASVRLDQWRQGAEDYRLAEVLKERGDAEVRKQVHEVLRQPRNYGAVEAFRRWARRRLAGRPVDGPLAPAVVCLTGNSRMVPNVPFQGKYRLSGNNYDSKHKAARFIDGNLNWPRGTHDFTAEEFTFDFNSPRVLEFAVLTYRDNEHGDDYIAEVSADGKAWRRFKVQRLKPACRGYWYGVKLDGQACRFLRVHTGHRGRKSVGEVYVYGR